MLQIYNTLTRQKEIFKPIHSGKISMYVCGITVYDYCHIGHARVLVAFDVITKFLRSQGWDVNYVRNITDIDDKIIKRANENSEEFNALTKRFIDYMHEDEARLGIARPDIEPRATAYIDQIVDMNKTLIEKGFAYAANNGDVYYRVTRFADYGKLTNKNVDELLVGARIEVDEIKEDPRDFVLWKAAKAGEPAWKSPWGNGRPGWHIECSAMSKNCCGETFDIHGGGPDLPFPHHENEIAQSEAANGCKYVNYWMHAGAVRVDGEKMSKSLGNFFTIRDVLEKYHPEVVRFLLVSSHYRSPINYAEDNLIEARTGLERFYSTLMAYSAVPAASFSELTGSKYYQSFVAAMNDDFNTRVAIASMYDLAREINNSKKNPELAVSLVAELKAMGNILGILNETPKVFLGCELVWPEEIEEKLSLRVLAKEKKDYQAADEIRLWLSSNGVAIKDSASGTEWWMETIPDVPWPVKEIYQGIRFRIRFSYSLQSKCIRRSIEIKLPNEERCIDTIFLTDNDFSKSIADARLIARDWITNNGANY